MMMEELQWRSPDAPLTPPISNHRLKNDDDEDQTQKRLHIIDLSGLSLDKVPDPTINLAAICKLNLSNNNLQNIPESVTAGLMNVVSLDLHSNQIKTLPNSIGGLSNLKVLNVSGNLLHSLPKSILKCRSLEELSANFNKLTALPEAIGFNLPNLKKLSINSNQIMFLPHSTTHLTSLRILDVRLNCLRSLPHDIQNLINLQILNASQNFHYLTNLPSSIGFIPSLVELDVSYNKITSLPSSIGYSTKLQRLRVEGNRLAFPPMEVVEMGLHTVKMYLTGELNLVQQNSPKKKRSWFCQFKKQRSVNLISYQHLEAVASPRIYTTMLSPNRAFFPSPRNSFTNLL